MDDCYVFCGATISKVTVNGVCRRAVSEVFAYEGGKYEWNYLGLPSLIGRNKREILGFIKEKVVGIIMIELD